MRVLLFPISGSFVKLAAACVFVGLLSGCAVYTVVDTAVSVTATAVETTADVVGGAVDLVVGDDDDDDDDDD